MDPGHGLDNGKHGAAPATSSANFLRCHVSPMLLRPRFRNAVGRPSERVPRKSGEKRRLTKVGQTNQTKIAVSVTTDLRVVYSKLLKNPRKLP